MIFSAAWRRSAARTLSRGKCDMARNKRRVTLLVTPQAAWNLTRLADMDHTNPGRVVDKLVRDRMIELREAVKHG